MLKDHPIQSKMDHSISQSMERPAMSIVYRKVTFRLYPTAKQEAAMLHTLGLHQRLYNVGQIQIRGKARTPGEPKTCEIMYKAGRWYASIIIQCWPKRQAGTVAAGLDWGVETFATLTLSDGTTKRIENPRHARQALKKLRAAQRELSRKKKGSHNREKARCRVVRIHQIVANRRNDFLHQTTAQLVATLAVITTETLNVKGMTANRGSHKRGLNREILSTAPAEFLHMLKYKAEEAGTKWVEVPTKQVKPSQTCSRCGRQEKKCLGLRVHNCVCGLCCGRDENAAQVMLNWALTGSATGQELAGCGVGSAGSGRKTRAKLPARKHETPPIQR